MERRKKLSEDEDDEMLDALKTLNEILDEYEPQSGFDAELFGQIVNSVTVKSNVELQFKLIGGISLSEKIRKKGMAI